MAYLILLLLAIPSLALASPIYLKPGQCISLQRSHRQICAEGQLQSREQLPPVTYAYCVLSEGKSPNQWELWQSISQGTKVNKHKLKSFAHFEEKKCQEEANKTNDKV